MLETKLIERIASELTLAPEQVAAVIELLDDGATVPFIAHYRKDATGNLEESSLEAIADRNNFYTGVMNRREAIKEALEKEGRLTDELRQKVDETCDKVALEDLYLPYKSRRPTKATMAEERGLGPLADFLMRQLPVDIPSFIATFVKPEKLISSPEEALTGACYILAERFATDPEKRAAVRNYMRNVGKVTTRPTKNAENTKTKYEAYYDFSEPVSKIPPHRILAILRGVKEGYLRLDITIDDEQLFQQLLAPMVNEPGSVFETAIRLALHEAYTRHLRPGIEKEIVEMLRREAEEEAVRVFRQNAENLLLSPAAGPIRAIGIVPIRKGCKVAVVDADGSLLEHQVVTFSDVDGNAEAEQSLLDLMSRHGTHAIAVANSPGSNEVSVFVKRALAKAGKEGAFAISLNAGPAAGYAVSKEGRDELEGLDPPLREAVFLARMVQDPLAELVKVEPRSIGVGQYQHDVNQKLLRDGLQKTIVRCVNRAGVDLNKASVWLLRYVSGIQSGTAQHIVAAREKLGRFRNRHQLLEVDGIGPRVFELCAGFLRITGGDNPLDATRIHPEHYPIVDRIAELKSVSVGDLLNNGTLLEHVDWTALKTDCVGMFTLADIRAELQHPARDIRGPFRAPKLVEGIKSLDDLHEGMDVEGVVTNVTDFGAFVDIGMQQDGLVHLSELSKRFVKDPREVIKVGDVVKVRVIKVDRSIPRISLSMKALQPEPRARVRRPSRPAPWERAETAGAPDAEPVPAGREQGDGRFERRPRRDDLRRRAGGEEMPQRRRRPDAESDERRSRSRTERHADDQERPERRGPRPPRRAARPGPGAVKYADEGGRLNTALADQLAALRDKFGGK